jgi:hypothetical protein
MAAGIVVAAAWPSAMLPHFILSALFLVLFLIKRASTARSNTFKELLLRGYLFVVLSHISVALGNTLSLPVAAQILCSFVFSQLIFAAYSARRGIFKVDELYSQEKFFKLAFEVLKYLHGNDYDSNFEREIDQFIGVSVGKETERRDRVYEKLVAVLARHSSAETDLLTAHIFMVFRHQLLRSRHAIESARQKTSVFDVVNKVLVFRAEETLRQRFEEKSREVHFPNYESYYKCNAFRALLLRSSLSSINFWEYTRRS